MAAKEISIPYAAPAAQTAVMCRRAIASLGWEPLEPEAGLELRAEEPAGGLCCVVWPVTVGIALRPEGPAATRIDVRASIAGWGPLQTRQLRDRLEALRRAIADVD